MTSFCDRGTTLTLLGLSSSFSWVDLLDLFRTVPLFRIFCRAASWIHAASMNHFLSREKGLLSVSNGENVMVFPGNRQVVVQ